jgi:CheY-like chemotaxis protein
VTLSTTKPALAGTTILVIDDDPDIRQMIAKVLHAAGAEVHAAADGASALDRLAQQGVDAVLLDWHLAEGSGSNLLHALHARYPELSERTAVITGDLLHSTAEAIGSHPVLAKPFRPTELIALIARLIERPPD